MNKTARDHANDLRNAWQGTSPMTSVEQVRGAVEIAWAQGTESYDPELFDEVARELCPMLREDGLLVG